VDSVVETEAVGRNVREGPSVCLSRLGGVHNRRMETAKCGDPAYFPKASGAFKRGASHVQNWIEPADAAKGRYHLIVNYACGWSARVILVRALKGLEDCVGITHTKLVIAPPGGWAMLAADSFAEDKGWGSVFDVYNWDGEGYGDGSEKFGKRQLSVPVLVDLQTKRVVSNDSAQICFILNSAFDAFATVEIDLYPETLRPQIERINAVVYPGINDGVYRCKFAGSDAAYDEAHAALYAAIAFVDEELKNGAFLCGDAVTLADVRTFCHLIRFDPIYRDFMLRKDRPNDKLPPRVVAYLERLHNYKAVALNCDSHLATVGYYNQMGGKATVAVCDAIYDESKYDWQPTRLALEEQRKLQNLPTDASLHI